MESSELHINILDDLSDELGDDLAQFLGINDSTGELWDDMTKRYGFHVTNHNNMSLSEFIGFVGDLELIKWMHETNKKFDKHEMFDGACRGGKSEVVKWLHLIFRVCTKNALDFACLGGHTYLVVWMIDLNRTRERNDFCSPSSMIHACEKGYFEIVTILHYFLYEPPRNALDVACRSGHLEIAKWLHEHGCKENIQNIVDDCCTRGHLEIIKWIYSEKPNIHRPLVEWVFRAAYLRGKLDIAKWAHSHQDFSSETLFKMEHLCVKSSSGITITRDVIMSVCSSNDLEFVKWLSNDSGLIRHSLWQYALYCACVSNNDQDIFVWLIEKYVTHNNSGTKIDYTCAIDKMDYACAAGRTFLAQALYHKGRYDNIENAIWCARENGHYELVDWLADPKNE